MIKSPDRVDSSHITMHFSFLLIELWFSSVDRIRAEDRVPIMANIPEHICNYSTQSDPYIHVQTHGQEDTHNRIRF